MKLISILAFIILSLFMINCSETKKDPAKESEVSKEGSTSGNKAFQLIESNCFSCHSPNPSSKSSIAPVMAEIKKSYLASTPEKEKFVNDMIAFLNDPDISKSKMKDAVMTYGLMPRMNFSEEQLKLIAEYIFDSGLEKEGWFENQYKLEKSGNASAKVILPPIEKGMQMAMQTKAVLGKHLLTAINTKGTENALEFCSTKAYPLTDSMAKSLNAKIKRVSDKNRNPKNIANEFEKEYIKYAKEAISKSEKVKPKLIESDGKITAFYPITLEKMCLQCHGQEKTEILPPTLKKIKSIYPKDKARGYKSGDLRGIWVVEMNK